MALPQPDEAKAASTVGPACAVYVSQSGWPEGSKEEDAVSCDDDHHHAGMKRSAQKEFWGRI